VGLLLAFLLLLPACAARPQPASLAPAALTYSVDARIGRAPRAASPGATTELAQTGS